MKSVAVTSVDGGAAPTNVTVGKTIRLGVEATYSDGSTAVVSSGVTWHCKDTACATVDDSGVMAGKTAGVARVNATVGGVTSPDLNVTVEAATELYALTVTATAVDGGYTVTATPAPGSGEMTRYKVTDADAKPSVSYDTVCDKASGWVDMPDDGGVTGSEGQVVTVVHLTEQGAKARAKGEATLPAASA